MTARCADLKKEKSIKLYVILEFVCGEGQADPYIPLWANTVRRSVFITSTRELDKVDKQFTGEG